MIQPPPPIPDGSFSFTTFCKWARDSVLALRIQEAPGALIHRTTRGTAVIPQEQTVRRSAGTEAAPMDHAIYVENYAGGEEDNTRAIFGVGNGQVFRCDPDSGEVLKKNNVGHGAFSPMWIVWSPINKKLYVTGGLQFNYWASSAATIVLSGIWQIDPVTLEKRGPYDPQDFYSGAPDVIDTKLGPMVYYAGDQKIYGIFSTGNEGFVYQFDPVINEFVSNTFDENGNPTVDPVEIADGMDPRWFDMYLDGDKLWITNDHPASGARPHNIHMLNLNTRISEWFHFETPAGATDVDVDTTFVPNFVTNPFGMTINCGWPGSPLKAGSNVVIDYLSGAVSFDFTNWTVNLDAENAWYLITKDGTEHLLPATFEVGYPTIAEAEEANEGVSLTVGATGSTDYGVFGLTTEAFPLPPAGGGITFRVRFTRVVPSGNNSFFAVVVVGGKHYLCSAASNLMGVLDLSGIDPFDDETGSYSRVTFPTLAGNPHKMVYVPATERIYVAMFDGNQIVVFDPATDSVEEVKTGFENPFHIVATDTKIWAVQRSAPGLKLIEAIPEEL